MTREEAIAEFNSVHISSNSITFEWHELEPDGFAFGFSTPKGVSRNYLPQSFINHLPSLKPIISNTYKNTVAMSLSFKENQ